MNSSTVELEEGCLLDSLLRSRESASSSALGNSIVLCRIDYDTCSLLVSGSDVAYVF